MIRIEIIELFEELLNKYELSKTSVINERSGSINNDIITLKKEIAEYNQTLLNLIEQISD